ncbi:MAG: DUF45 domain-containing protein [candidate division Zixibacteria bacterium]|nr:DUF45 domain-containing protein [candidate division Zixibacteria bacterium]
MSNGKKQMRNVGVSNYDLFEPSNIFPELQTTSVPASPDLTTPELITPDTELIINEEPEKELPSEIELYEIFDRLNIKFFNNEIPRLNIKYSKRMLIAGTYSPRRKEIKIGWKYHLIYKDDIEDTMAHEMIHYFVPNHGRKFKEIANKFGISLKAKDHPDLRLACKYLYYCPNCKREYPRRKRLRMASCGKCTSGRSFDARYKLKLKKN